MKKLLFAGILMLVLGAVQAQKVYFIYIQSETNTPFFVKMGDKVSSATASGYLILSKLVDSTYQFTIGKPGQAAAESRFSVTIDKKDHGFLLRETDGKFNLFDLQALTLLQPVASATNTSGAVAKRTDAFTVLLAQAANDPSLLEIRTAATPAVKKEKVKQQEPAPAVALITKENEPDKTEPSPQENTIQSDTVAKNDTADNDKSTDAVAAAPAEKEDEIKPETTTQDTAQQTVALKEEEQKTAIPAQEEKPYKPSVITRKSESSTSEGFGLVFLDAGEEAVDTIRILIPNQSLVFKKEDEVTEDAKKFLNITNTDSAQATIAVDEANDTLVAAKKRTTCKTEATDKDFLKLRKNMAAKETDDAMISEAQKFFKKACFSTGQVRNLSSLFLSASGKYHFFDAAYGHVSDQEQYAALQSELNDAYYVNRFKALIAKQ